MWVQPSTPPIFSRIALRKPLAIDSPTNRWKFGLTTEQPAYGVDGIAETSAAMLRSRAIVKRSCMLCSADPASHGPRKSLS